MTIALLSERNFELINAYRKTLMTIKNINYNDTRVIAVISWSSDKLFKYILFLIMEFYVADEIEVTNGFELTLPVKTTSNMCYSH